MTEEKLPDDNVIARRIVEECRTNDTEMDHIKADHILVDLLIELGYTETVRAYNEGSKWYA